METSAIPASAAEIQHQLDIAKAQVAAYEQELKRLVEAERLKAQELTLAYKQLQAFAKDLKTAFDAERHKSQELEQAYYDTLLRLTHASQYKDEETGAHIHRLSHYTKTLALYLGLGEAEAELLFAAAPMHDVGKIGVPDAVLLKRGPLNPDEWHAMRKHPGMGASLLKGSNSLLLERAREIALTHHERWDGSGYPQGLSGEEIPLAGRIVMLADQYDALRSKRSYKLAFDHAKTCDIILNGDGHTRPAHFAPRLLEAFRAIHQEFAAIYARIAD
ncbi:MAG: HD domain-containing protein [Deltaproteobacteria bacterium]|nr:HD domain-containing protein [Deltaproteobacteria bacterium]